MVFSVSTWAEMAKWAEFRAAELRKEADKAEEYIGTPPTFAYAAAARKAAQTMEADAKLWAFNRDEQIEKDKLMELFVNKRKK